MSDVFVSYARDDRDKAEQLAHALEARGFDVWWDPELLPGEQYAQKISKVLAESKAVLVVWSSASAGRSWVLDEASVGRDRGVLVPVLIDQVEAPLGFRQVQAEDLSAWPQAGADNFERVVRALEGLRGAPATPKPASPFSTPRPAPTRRSGFPTDSGNESSTPSRKRWPLYAGLAAIAILALVAVTRIAGDGASPGDGGDDNPPISAGGDEYGLSKTQWAALDMKPLVERALSQTGIDTIEAGANKGDARGQLLLCGAYDWGLGGLAADANQARPWCEQAAEQGQHLATFYLSLYHTQGIAGFAKDPERGRELMEQAAEAGDSRAQAALGHYYQDGQDGFARDDAKALEYYRKAAMQGNPDGQFSTAWMYENGRGVPVDYATALVWYQKLADDGSPAGTRAVGWMYYKGWAADRDLEKARLYWKKASDLGDGQGTFNLALLYEHGEGVAKDLDKAIALYRKASEQGFVDADEALQRLAAND